MDFIVEQWGVLRFTYLRGRENQRSGSVQDGLQPVEVVSGNTGWNIVEIVEFAAGDVPMSLYGRAVATSAALREFDSVRRNTDPTAAET